MKSHVTSFLYSTGYIQIHWRFKLFNRKKFCWRIFY